MKKETCKPVPFTPYRECCSVDDNGKMACHRERVPVDDAPFKGWIVTGIIIVIMVLLVPFSATTPTDVTRVFDADYIVLDAVFLVCFVTLLVLRKLWFPMAIAGVFATIIFFIDGIIWWYLGIREIYAPFSKWIVDFMMDISYGIVTFSWMVMALQGHKDSIYFGALLFCGWLAVSIASQGLPIWDATVITVRHMDYARYLSIIVVIVGYAMLALLEPDAMTVLRVFVIGCAAAFFMEFSLWAAGIRPSGFDFVAYDTLILVNQGVPYIHVILSKFVPAFNKGVKNSMETIQSIILPPGRR